jgi:hypothetical protein
MQASMFLIILRAIVKSFANGQLDVIEELHIRTLIDFVRVASRMVGHKKAEGTARRDVEGLAVQLIDHQCPLVDGCQWNTRVKIIT